MWFAWTSKTTNDRRAVLVSSPSPSLLRSIPESTSRSSESFARRPRPKPRTPAFHALGRHSRVLPQRPVPTDSVTPHPDPRIPVRRDSMQHIPRPNPRTPPESNALGIRPGPKAEDGCTLQLGRAGREGRNHHDQTHYPKPQGPRRSKATPNTSNLRCRWTEVRPQHRHGFVSSKSHTR
jgi:hypothetical protein